MPLYTKWYSGGSGTVEEQLTTALDVVTTRETSREIYDFLNDFFRSQPQPHPIFNHDRYYGFGYTAFLQLTPSLALATLFLTSDLGCQFVHAARFGLRTSYEDSNGKVISRFWLPDSPTDRCTNRNTRQARTVLDELAGFVSFALTDDLPGENDHAAVCVPEAALVRTLHFYGRCSTIYIKKSLLVYDCRLQVPPGRLYQQWLSIAALLTHELIHALTNAIHGLDFHSPEMRFEHDEFSELGYAFTNYVFGGNIENHDASNQLLLRDVPTPGWQSPSNTIVQYGERYPYVSVYGVNERLWVVPERYVHALFQALREGEAGTNVETRVPQQLEYTPNRMGSWY